MKILTDKQTVKTLKKLGKSLDTEQYCLVEDEEKLYVISKEVRKMNLEKYKIKQIGIPLI